ncbi:MAG: lipopolysaccharide transport periplasmic protein LptA [Pseudomonadota bacterium]
MTDDLSGGARRWLAAIAIATLSAAPAAAQLAADSDLPLDITSDRLESEEKVATWIGEVRVVQGDSILTSDRLVITQSEGGGVEEIRAIGNVRYATAKEAIKGDIAVYSETTRSIRMTGDVVVTQGEQILTGEDLTYWVDTGRVIFAAKKGERVRGVFQTKAIEGQS